MKENQPTKYEDLPAMDKFQAIAANADAAELTKKYVALMREEGVSPTIALMAAEKFLFYIIYSSSLYENADAIVKASAANILTYLKEAEATRE